MFTVEHTMRRSTPRAAAAAELGVRGELFVGVVDLGQDPLCAHQEGAAGLGEPGSAIAALDEDHAELELERAQPLRQRWLRDAERPGGVGETACVGDRRERTELANLHDK